MSLPPKEAKYIVTHKLPSECVRARFAWECDEKEAAFLKANPECIYCGERQGYEVRVRR